MLIILPMLKHTCIADRGLAVIEDSAGRGLSPVNGESYITFKTNVPRWSDDVTRDIANLFGSERPMNGGML
jgi:hypothetical protein